jgi:hypothetical protein
MQMSESGKNCRFEGTVYARYFACYLRCVKRRGHLFLFLLPFFLWVYVLNTMTAWRGSQGSSQEAGSIEFK